MKKINISLLILLISVPVFSQQHPFKINWKKIDSEHFEIVFPEEITDQGKRMANTLEFLYAPASLTLKEKPKKISVFLSNHSTLSNGYVSSIPRKSYFYTQAMQDVSVLGSEDWLESLAVHEFRHVVQNDLSNKGFTKLGSFFFGSFGRTGLTYSEPLWYVEGDAVVTETMYTQLGRGRIPAFTMPIKAQALSLRNYKYQQAYLGSFKNYSPSWYALGYLLEMYKRKEFGADVNNKIINRSTRYSFLPYAYSLAQKKETGLNAKALFKSAIDEYKFEWNKQLQEIEETEAVQISGKEKFYTNYEYPQKVGNDIYALKSGLNYPKTLVKIDKNGKETKIKQLLADKISAAAGKITYSDYASHLRYGEKSYSNIYVYDTLSQKAKQITFRSRFFAPSLSPGGRMIACVESKVNSYNKIVILNAVTGEIFKEFDSPNNDFPRTPAWSPDGNGIVFTHSSTKGQALSVLNIKTGKVKTFVPYSFKNIGNPQFYKQYIVFNMPNSGIDNIFALDTLSKEIKQLTVRKFGSFNAFFSESDMIFQDYTPMGYRIVSGKPEFIDLETLHNKNFYESKLIKNALQYEDTTKILGKTQMPSTDYEVKKYPRILNGINLHAWGFFPDDDFENVDLSIFSENKLNTLSIEAGLSYNIANDNFKKYASAEWAAFFPVFRFETNSRKRRVEFDAEGVSNIVNWQENSFISGIYLPLNFTKAGQYSGLTLGSDIQVTKRTALPSEGDYVAREGNFTPLTNYFVFQIYRRAAIRDVAPRLGFYLKGLIRNTPFEQEFSGSQKAFLSKIYLPGLFKNHSLKLDYAFEYKESDIMFANQFVFPRGYEVNYFNLFIKLSGNYHFPVLHPDLNLFNILYLKRIRTNLFYDYGFAANNVDGTSDNTFTYESFGSELWFDLNLFNIKYDFDAGIRLSYRKSDKKFVFDFIMIDIPIGSSY